MSRAETNASTQILRHRPLREVVAERIREMIISGELAQGERLIEDRLAEQLGVSRNPIREAIRSLEATGLVEVLPRRGAHVAVFDLDDIKLIQEIRRVLDCWIVVAAAERHDTNDLARIDACIAVGRDAATAGDVVRAAECHREFHLAIEAASKNSYSTTAMDPLRQRTELVFSMLAEERGETGWDEHEAIRDAIADRDAGRAERLVSEHIVRALDHLINRLTPPQR
jgi:DNA-binding GntR family transcriptional regulator